MSNITNYFTPEELQQYQELVARWQHAFSIFMANGQTIPGPRNAENLKLFDDAIRARGWIGTSDGRELTFENYLYREIEDRQYLEQVKREEEEAKAARESANNQNSASDQNEVNSEQGNPGALKIGVWGAAHDPEEERRKMCEQGNQGLSEEWCIEKGYIEPPPVTTPPMPRSPRKIS